MTKSFLVINGPNLNMLGKREVETYGSLTLENINNLCKKKASELGVNLEFFQHNIEGEIVSKLHEAKKNHHAVIINAAAYTHTSVAIRDALILTDLPIIEVHMSNVYKRETFRHKSFISDIAIGVIAGFGFHSYILGIEAAFEVINK